MSKNHDKIASRKIPLSYKLLPDHLFNVTHTYVPLNQVIVSDDKRVYSFVC